MLVEATKVCSKCKEPKTLSQFNSHGNGRLASRCKQCRRVEHRAWKQRNPARRLWRSAVCASLTRGIECTLTLEWVEQKLAGVCEVTGLPFVFDQGRHAFMPSIDRIDSSKGHTPENCRAVLWIINAAKNDLGEDAFQSALRQVAEAMLERC